MEVVKKDSKQKPRRKRIETPFARNLQDIVKERGISFRAAAELAQVSPSVISEWTAGSTPHDLLAVQRLANALKVNFEWLITGTTTRLEKTDLSLSELFSEEPTAFTGLFKISATRLIKKDEK